MRLSISQPALKSALAHATSVVEPRSAAPILTHVGLEATKEGLTIRATDLDIEIRLPVAAEVSRPGAVAVPAQMLRDIIGKLPSAAHVELETTDNGRLAIFAGRSRFHLAILDPSDLPSIAADTYPATLPRIPLLHLSNALSATKVAISTDETRYYLQGVYLHAREDMLSAVATDGHRLSLHETATGAPEGMPGIIVPRKTVGLLCKLLEPLAADVEQVLTLDVSEHQIRVTLDDGTIIVSKTIDGQFPNYQGIMPTDDVLDRAATVDGKDLMTAVDRVVVISDDKSRAARLSFSEDEIEVSLPPSASGSARDFVTCALEGEPVDLSVNARYLASMVSATTGDVITIRCGSPGTPIMIRDGTTTMLCMPMRA